MGGTNTLNLHLVLRTQTDMLVQSPESLDTHTWRQTTLYMDTVLSCLGTPILVEDPEEGVDAQQTEQKEQRDVGLHQLAQDGGQRVTALEDTVAGQSVRARLADVIERDGAQERSGVAHDQNELHDLEHRLSSVHLQEELLKHMWSFLFLKD